ncbi:MAG: FixH family protein [Myxococcota bacterium]
MIALLLACAAPAPANTTAQGLYAIRYATSPDPVPLSTLFEVETFVTDARTGEPVEDAVVRVDARMPQHGHGMATKPEDVAGPHPDGRYVTRGMKLHMPGEWTLRFEVDGPAGRDTLEVRHRQ